MGQKTFGVRFYKGTVLGPHSSVSEILQELFNGQQQGQPLPHVLDGSVSYELRSFNAHNGGTVFTGVLAVLRDDAPNIRDHLGAERPLDLQPGERLIEKNHFILFQGA